MHASYIHIYKNKLPSITCPGLRINKKKALIINRSKGIFRIIDLLCSWTAVKLLQLHTLVTSHETAHP